MKAICGPLCSSKGAIKDICHIYLYVLSLLYHKLSLALTFNAPSRLRDTVKMATMCLIITKLGFSIFIFYKQLTTFSLKFLTIPYSHYLLKSLLCTIFHCVTTPIIIIAQIAIYQSVNKPAVRFTIQDLCWYGITSFVPYWY